MFYLFPLSSLPDNVVSLLGALLRDFCLGDPFHLYRKVFSQRRSEQKCFCNGDNPGWKILLRLRFQNENQNYEIQINIVQTTFSPLIFPPGLSAEKPLLFCEWQNKQEKAQKEDVSRCGDVCPSRAGRAEEPEALGFSPMTRREGRDKSDFLSAFIKIVFLLKQRRVRNNCSF